MPSTSAEIPSTLDAGQSSGPSIFDTTICLVLSRSSLGTSKKAKGVVQTVAATAVQSTPEMIALNKKLFVAPEYKAIKSRDSELREYLDKVSLPSLLKGGTYAIPIPLVEQVDDAIHAYTRERGALVEALKAAWPRIVDEAEQALGAQLFDPRNYPAAERLNELFKVEHRWINYGTPSKLKAIKASIWREEREKAEIDVRNAKEQAINDVRGRALKLVSHIVERLTPETEGSKKKVFRDSLVGNVREFLDIFPILNTAAGDNELAPIVERARLVLDGVDAKLLRDDDLVRQKVQEEFAAIEAKLDGMVVEQTRKIVFDDDAEVA